MNLDNPLVGIIDLNNCLLAIIKNRADAVDLNQPKIHHK
ncbi:MAG: hypothetical protein ACJAYN_000931 [Bermanella sp.]|jgi:hypothetical protein